MRPGRRLTARPRGTQSPLQQIFRRSPPVKASHEDPRPHCQLQPPAWRVQADANGQYADPMVFTGLQCSQLKGLSENQMFKCQDERIHTKYLPVGTYQHQCPAGYCTADGTCTAVDKCSMNWECGTLQNCVGVTYTRGSFSTSNLVYPLVISSLLDETGQLVHLCPRAASTRSQY